MGLVEQIWLTYVEEVYQVRYLFLEIRLGWDFRPIIL